MTRHRPFRKIVEVWSTHDLSTLDAMDCTHGYDGPRACPFCRRNVTRLREGRPLL